MARSGSRSSCAWSRASRARPAPQGSLRPPRRRPQRSARWRRVVPRSSSPPLMRAPLSARSPPHGGRCVRSCDSRCSAEGAPNAQHLSAIHSSTAMCAVLRLRMFGGARASACQSHAANARTTLDRLLRGGDACLELGESRLGDNARLLGQAAGDVSRGVPRASGGEGSPAALPASSAARGAGAAPHVASAGGASPTRIACRMHQVVSRALARLLHAGD